MIFAPYEADDEHPHFEGPSIVRGKRSVCRWYAAWVKRRGCPDELQFQQQCHPELSAQSARTDIEERTGAVTIQRFVLYPV